MSKTRRGCLVALVRRCVSDGLWGPRFASLLFGCLVVCVCGLLVGVDGVSAAVRHEYLSAVSEKLSEGVPAAAEVPGGLGELNAMTIDSGNVWLAEKLPGSEETRVDEFDGASGAFILQIPQVPGLSGVDGGIAVGHGTGEPQVYVGAVKEGTGRVAVFSSTGG